MTREAVVADKVPLSITGSHTRGARLKGGVERVEINMRRIAVPVAGFWAEITNDLEHAAVIDSDLALSEATDIRVHPRITPGRSPLWTIAKGSDSVRVTPEKAQRSEGVWVAKNRIRYLAPWPGVEYLELVDAGHYLDDRILLGKGHPTTLAFRLSTTGINWKTLQGAHLRIREPVLLPPAGSELASVGLRWERKLDGKDLLLTVNLPEGDWAGWTLDPTIELQPNAADGKDTQTWGGAQSVQNYGAAPTLSLVDNRTCIIMEFSLPAISGATCISAQMQITKTGPAGWDAIRRVNIYSLVQANSAWIEGAGNNTLAAMGEPCLDALAADGVGGVLTAWASGGQFRQAAGDTEPDTMGFFDILGTAPAGTQYSSELTAARVQGWLDTPDTNYGITFSAGTQVGTIASSDNATAAYRPKLTVEYSLARRRKLIPVLRR